MRSLWHEILSQLLQLCSSKTNKVLWATRSPQVDGSLLAIVISYNDNIYSIQPIVENFISDGYPSSSSSSSSSSPATTTVSSQFGQK
jgi:hypothetical protein